MSVAIHTSQNVLLEYEPASVGERIMATLIDYLIFIGWVLVVIFLPVSIFNVNMSTFYVVLVTLPILFYDLICEWQLNGQSLGKIAMDIRVVMLDGSQPGLGGYLIRWLLRLIDTRMFGGLVAIIAIAANGKGQRLGDMAARTTVVKTKPKVALEDITYQVLPETYAVRFPEVRFLTDRDIQIVREAVRRGNNEVAERTAQRIKDVTGIQTDLSARDFLKNVIDDYQALAARE
ncbi:RDD family protein [Nibrella saemangeumensis]|uniref:RDD family protein n=1 Tax=Nibrella saemangeumensis TaxID=1084526 RepID=A0ABP8N1N9_9BACT